MEQYRSAFLSHLDESHPEDGQQLENYIVVSNSETGKFMMCDVTTLLGQESMDTMTEYDSDTDELREELSEMVHNADTYMAKLDNALCRNYGLRTLLYMRRDQASKAITTQVSLHLLKVPCYRARTLSLT